MAATFDVQPHDEQVTIQCADSSADDIGRPSGQCLRGNSASNTSPG